MKLKDYNNKDGKELWLLWFDENNKLHSDKFMGKRTDEKLLEMEVEDTNEMEEYTELWIR